MIAELELQEYLDEIREKVCSRCVERPEGGPPCVPLGKPCGVELHLPQLVESVREVHSGLIAPYLESDRCHICTTCSYLHGEHCPCPMDTLAVLVVEAIETVERRHAQPKTGKAQIAALSGNGGAEIGEIAQAYEDATGSWTGCDWPTVFGRSKLNLQDWIAGEAEIAAVEAVSKARRNGTGEVAAVWLAEVEQRAKKAESEAAEAVAAADAGEWEEAVVHARRAWLSEFHTGRPLRLHPPTWQRFYHAVAAAAKPHLHPDTRIQMNLCSGS